jgi:hypothetical protein
MQRQAAQFPTHSLFLLEKMFEATSLHPNLFFFFGTAARQQDCDRPIITQGDLQQKKSASFYFFFAQLTSA